MLENRQIKETSYSGELPYRMQIRLFPFINRAAKIMLTCLIL